MTWGAMAGAASFVSQLTAAVTPFSPTDIAGLMLWLDANDIDTLFQNNTLTTPVTADNDVVGGWTDKSGNSRTFTQTTTANKPLYKTNIIGGLPCLIFDNDNDNLACTSFNPGTAHTVFAIYQSTGATIDTDLILNNSSAEYVLRVSNVALGYRPGGGIDEVGANHSMVGQTPYLISSKRSGVTVDFYRDGEHLTTSEPLDADNATAIVRLGHPSVTELGAYIGEILVYNSALSDSDRNLVEQFLFDKWGFL